MGWNHYEPIIADLLQKRGDAGATTDEIITVAQSAVENAGDNTNLRYLDKNGTGWGVRAALTRMWKKGLLEKAYEYRDRPPRVVVDRYDDGREVERQIAVGPVRVYRYFLPTAGVPVTMRKVDLVNDESDPGKWYKRTAR